MRAKLITETSNNVKLNEKENCLYIEGIFSTADIMNENGRRYKKDVLTREIDKLQPMIEQKCLWSELGHPTNPEINPDRIAGIIEKLDWEDDNVYGRAKIIDTPMGNITRTLVKEGNLGISSRGLGTVNEKDNYVNDDFNLITWDIVISPSNNPSWVKGIYEEKEFGPKIEPEKEITLEEVQREYHRKVWQVLKNIEKNI